MIMMPVERLSCVSPKASRESIALLKSLTPVCTQPHTPPYHSVAAGGKAVMQHTAVLLLLSI
jgi:hypothetical protein